jgi:hypothetical protein
VGRDSLESYPIASGSQDQVGARSVQVSFFPSVVEGWKEVTIGLEFLQVSVKDFPQGGIDGDGTGSFFSFGGGLPEGDRRSYIINGQRQRLRYPAAGVETDTEQTSIPIIVETLVEQAIEFGLRENLSLSVTVNFHDTFVLLVKRKVSSSILEKVFKGTGIGWNS